MKFKHSDIEIPREDPFKNCKLNRQPNAIILTQIVQNYSESFVLSINGEWGTGKTTFMKMWAAYLKQQEITSIYFNAWENDFISDPMIALLGELQQLKTSKTAKTLNSILDIGSKIAIKAIPTLTKGIVKHYCGNELAEAAKDALKAGAEIFKTEVIEYENKKNKLVTFKEELSSFCEKNAYFYDKYVRRIKDEYYEKDFLDCFARGFRLCRICRRNAEEAERCRIRVERILG